MTSYPWYHSIHLVCLLFTSLLIGCGAAQPTTPELDPNSMEAQQAAIRAKENHHGKAPFDRACAGCHNGAVKKAPHKDMIGLMTAEAIHATLTTGVMQQAATSLSAEEKIAVAEYLAGSPFGTTANAIPACQDGQSYDPAKPQLVTRWGINSANTRHVANAGNFNQATVAQLTPKWAISFPGANRVRSQPAAAGGLLFVGSHSGRVYALDQESGCEVWSFQAAGEVRTGIVVATDDSQLLFFGDVLANAYALNIATGQLQWRQRVDDHPNATITAAPALHNGVLYIPVSSLEVSLAIDPTYPCCTFRGSILALDADTGSTRWRTYTIAQPATQQSKNSAGTPMMGPSGAVVWNTPAIDAKRSQLYFGTGENMSSPATDTSDALFALDLQTGAVKWVFQATENDAWNVACDTSTPASCPKENGPDYDFGGPAMIVSSDVHGDLILAGQKSGFVHAVDPDNGSLVWQTQVGRGGIQGGIHFGMAAAGQRVFVPISDMADGRRYNFPDQPGMHALDVNTGKILWSSIHQNLCGDRAFCHPGISQVPTVVGNLVVAGAMDGWVRAYSISTGEVVWQLDTTEDFDGIQGTATGGSFSGAAGPILVNGQLILSSGYGIYNHMAGNLLLVLETHTP